MRPVLVLPEDLILHIEGHIALGGEPPLYLVSRPALRARLARQKARAMTGDPENPEAYRRALGRGRGPLVVGAPAGRAPRIAAAVRAALPDAPVLVVGDGRLHVPGAITVPLSADRKSTRLNSSHSSISYAAFCLKKKKKNKINIIITNKKNKIKTSNK